MLQPAVIDGLAFVRAAGVLKGRLGIESLPRLARSGCSGSVLDFVLTGGNNERDKPELRLAVDGSVRLQCQRCLGAMDFPLRFEAQLELAASEDEIAAADDGIERIVAARDMDVAVLVEDEIILALPMVPKHEQCSAAEGSDGGAKPSAFQALAALKN
ncbi:MAG: DUF177 domain-containing protein [Burkholderiales bacterium]|nr:DUF177 domain-containing protein [Burkholderiales bacterium]